MDSRYSNTENRPNNHGKDSLDEFLNRVEKRKHTARQREPRPEENNPLKKFLKVAVIVLFGFFLIRAASNFSIAPVTNLFSTVVNTGPSENLLNRMNAVMVEMGYTDLTQDDLRELRSEGVTATYISNVRSLGFTDLTLEQAVRLANADVSSAFMAMMLELGYDLGIDDFIELRRAGVTAHFTSNVHDLGYTDVTTEQLIRMRRIGVTPSLIERLQEERGQDVTLEEIIRYRISNQ